MQTLDTAYTTLARNACLADLSRLLNRHGATDLLAALQDIAHDVADRLDARRLGSDELTPLGSRAWRDLADALETAYTTARRFGL